MRGDRLSSWRIITNSGAHFDVQAARLVVHTSGHLIFYGPDDPDDRPMRVVPAFASVERLSPVRDQPSTW
jgi:hypothetical protein